MSEKISLDSSETTVINDVTSYYFLFGVVLLITN